MEAINLKEAMILNPDRVRPEPYHDRLGQQLDPSLSKVYEQMNNIQSYARENGMKINHKKSKFMVFNPTVNYDFIPK